MQDACESPGSQDGILIFTTELVRFNVGTVMLGEMWSGCALFSRLLLLVGENSGHLRKVSET